MRPHGAFQDMCRNLQKGCENGTPLLQESCNVKKKSNGFSTAKGTSTPKMESKNVFPQVFFALNASHLAYGTKFNGDVLRSRETDYGEQLQWAPEPGRFNMWRRGERHEFNMWARLERPLRSKLPRKGATLRGTMTFRQQATSQQSSGLTRQNLIRWTNTRMIG